MKLAIQHKWDLTFQEAQHLQKELQSRVDLSTTLELPQIHIVAAADISYSRKSQWLFGVVVLVRFPEMTLLATYANRMKTHFPYVPGYLSFREVPVLIPIFEKIETEFDVILCDGQGIAHPRRFGLASHVGVLLDKPAIGCAKSRLIGTYQEPGPLKGDFSDLMDGAERIGMVLRTRDRVKPLFISPGHKMDFDTARKITLACVQRYRIPEPLRLAHQIVNKIRAQETEGIVS
ncbi:MAG: deoxyribonuclease V [Calditrichaeota bacterium]|nr:deoxyribonuclease V [Calditrichota bacterium]